MSMKKTRKDDFGNNIFENGKEKHKYMLDNVNEENTKSGLWQE